MYFTIKDERSSISCVMWRSNLAKLRFRPTINQEIIVNGSINVYVPNGSYSIQCASIERAGEGELAIAFEKLKKKLQQKGYFDSTTKKKLPRFPQHIILLTSKTGSVLQDMLKIAKRRWNLTRFSLIDTAVQGAFAVDSLVSNLKIADNLGADIIILARGGGSAEDLWCFNDEKLADEIHKAKTPIISAVGHETDFSISDFTSDLRASTPSVAIELAVPDANEFRLFLDNEHTKLTTYFKKHYFQKKQILKELQKILFVYSPKNKIDRSSKDLEQAKLLLDARFANILRLKKTSILPSKEGLDFAYKMHIRNQQGVLETLKQKLLAFEPKRHIKDNLAQVVKNEKLARLQDINEGEEFTLMDSYIKIKAKAIKKEPLKT